jgi:hypothetical protein
MKYLSDYMSDAQTVAFDKHGAFFAFGQKQFDEKKVEGVVYASTGSGMIAPKENMAELIKELNEIYHASIAQDIAENGIDGIISRELGNYECDYTGNIDDAVEALEDYGIIREQVKAIFLQERVA